MDSSLLKMMNVDKSEGDETSVKGLIESDAGPFLKANDERAIGDETPENVMIPPWLNSQLLPVSGQSRTNSNNLQYLQARLGQGLSDTVAIDVAADENRSLLYRFTHLILSERHNSISNRHPDALPVSGAQVRRAVEETLSFYHACRSLRGVNLNGDQVSSATATQSEIKRDIDDFANLLRAHMDNQFNTSNQSSRLINVVRISKNDYHLLSRLKSYETHGMTWDPYASAINQKSCLVKEELWKFKSAKSASDPSYAVVLNTDEKASHALRIIAPSDVRSFSSIPKWIMNLENSKSEEYKDFQSGVLHYATEWRNFLDSVQEVMRSAPSDIRRSALSETQNDLLNSLDLHWSNCSPHSIDKNKKAGQKFVVAAMTSHIKEMGKRYEDRHAEVNTGQMINDSIFQASLYPVVGTLDEKGYAGASIGRRGIVDHLDFASLAGSNAVMKEIQRRVSEEEENRLRETKEGRMLRDLEEQISTLRSVIPQMDSEIGNKKALLTSLDTDISNAQETLNSDRSRVRSLQTRLIQLDRQVTNANQELEGYRSLSRSYQRSNPLSSSTSTNPTRLPSHFDQDALPPPYTPRQMNEERAEAIQSNWRRRLFGCM